MSAVSVRNTINSHYPSHSLSDGLREILTAGEYSGTNNYPFEQYWGSRLSSAYQQSANNSASGAIHAYEAGSRIGVRATLESWNFAPLKLNLTNQYPDESKDPAYNSVPQGIARHRGNTNRWYFTDTNGDFVSKKSRIHIVSTKQPDNDLNDGPFSTYKLPDDIWDKRSHVGGCSFDYKRGILWIALEPGSSGSASTKGLLALKDSGSGSDFQTRFESEFFDLDQAQSPWVGFCPLNDCLYTSNFDQAPGTIFAHKIRKPASGGFVRIEDKDHSFVAKRQDGSGLEFTRVQGGCVTPHGHLHLVMDKRGRGGVHSFRLSNGRRFNYYNVSDPSKTEEGNTDPTGLGYRLPAFEFQDICYSYEGGSEILHMLVMERRPLKKNKVTINHFSV